VVLTGKRLLEELDTYATSHSIHLSRFNELPSTEDFKTYQSYLYWKDAPEKRMTFRRIQHKLSAAKYLTIGQFWEDVKSVTANLIKMTKPESSTFICATKLKEGFEEIWQRSLQDL